MNFAFHTCVCGEPYTIEFSYLTENPLAVITIILHCGEILAFLQSRHFANLTPSDFSLTILSEARDALVASEWDDKFRHCAL